MLNTSLHNPSVREKPNVESFIKMNNGINEGGDLPQDLLKVTCLIIILYISISLMFLSTFTKVLCWNCASSQKVSFAWNLKWAKFQIEGGCNLEICWNISCDQMAKHDLNSFFKEWRLFCVQLICEAYILYKEASWMWWFCLKLDYANGWLSHRYHISKWFWNWRSHIWKQTMISRWFKLIQLLLLNNYVQTLRLLLINTLLALVQLWRIY